MGNKLKPPAASTGSSGRVYTKTKVTADQLNEIQNPSKTLLQNLDIITKESTIQSQPASNVLPSPEELEKMKKLLDIQEYETLKLPSREERIFNLEDDKGDRPSNPIGSRDNLPKERKRSAGQNIVIPEGKLGPEGLIKLFEVYDKAKSITQLPDDIILDKLSIKFGIDKSLLQLIFQHTTTPTWTKMELFEDIPVGYDKTRPKPNEGDFRPIE